MRHILAKDGSGAPLDHPSTTKPTDRKISDEREGLELGPDSSIIHPRNAPETSETSGSAPDSLNLDTAVEDEIRRLLLEHFAPSYQDRVNSYVQALLAPESYVSRFEYLRSVIGSDGLRPEVKILISGCGAGSEMLEARKLGLEHIYGVEVEQFWITVCQRRLKYFSNMHTSHYDGDYLPYDDAEFDVVASGHVVEHTRDPELYLRESMRVLVPGGYLSLEFPNRYHHTELHTHLLSFEWLPRPIRNAIVRALSSLLSPLKDDVKTRYSAITATNLQQISIGGIKRSLNRIGEPFSILNSVRAMPGVTRCVIRKD